VGRERLRRRVRRLAGGDELGEASTQLHKRKTQPQLPRDKRGWQVAPAPDGRGTPPSTKRPMFRQRGFIYFIVALLALNWLSVLLFEPATQPRVTIPSARSSSRRSRPEGQARDDQG